MGNGVTKMCTCGDSSANNEDESNEKEKNGGCKTKCKKVKASGSSGGSLFQRHRKGKIKDEEPVSNAPKVETTLKAAMLIQRWYRQYLARMEVRRLYTWTIFQSIEYAGEQDQMKLYNFFNALMTHIPTAKSGPGNSSPASRSPSLDENRKTLNTEYGDPLKLEDITVESDYKGAHLTFPLTRQGLEDLIDCFKKKKLLHTRYVILLLQEAATVLRSKPNLNQVSTAISRQITICGDLHGKLDDLLVIFYKNGLPSSENPYVFNGDYVDRGKRSAEVFLLLLSCLIVFPNAVYLNRGNHEDHIMNLRYGFSKEVKAKYKHHAGLILRKIEEVYRWLPLGTVIDKKVLVVHGGISDLTDLQKIRKLDRHKYVSILRPPIRRDSDSEDNKEVCDNHEWKQVFDLLWSDPQHVSGCVPNSFRGGGSYFGPDVTEAVLKRHDLSLLVRSHECKPEGYEFMHNNKCLTIFSASNYYEVGSNKGAYVKLLGQVLTPHFVQYTAVGRPRKLTIRQRVGLVESSALRELRTRVMCSREAITNELKNFDTDDTGFVSVADWCTAMEKGSGLSLPWRMLREKMVEVEETSGKIRYETTFQQEGTTKNGDIPVAEVLYRNKSSLETIFRIIDKDNSGQISMEEFRDACDLLSQHLSNPIPHQQMLDMAKSMDMNKDGFIDFNEFLETFRLVDMGVNGDVDMGADEPDGNGDEFEFADEDND